MYFQYNRLSKTSLDHSMESADSEHPLTVNKLEGRKHWRNLHENTFIMFFYPSLGK